MRRWRRGERRWRRGKRRWRRGKRRWRSKMRSIWGESVKNSGHEISLTSFLFSFFVIVIAKLIIE